MLNISRREFLTATGAAIASISRASGDPLGLPIGCQTYPVRQMIGKDFEGTLQQLAAIGYRSIEMCSPAGYKDGFGGLAHLSGSELRKKIQAAGLQCESSHFTPREFRESLDAAIGFAKDMGLKQMVLSSFGLPKNASMADWVKAAEDLNRAGEKIHAAGMEAGFHNHAMEFEKLDGTLVYDKLLETLHPKLVKLQFQVSVVSQGYHAADYFSRHPGRFLSIHLQDWSESEKKTVAVGQGVVDWNRLFSAAKKAGVKNYFVELNLEQMKQSYSYLHSLRV